MMPTLNGTHDVSLTSWADRSAGSDFPVQNLPFGIFSRRGQAPSGGVAIGDQIFDLAAGVEANLFTGDAETAARAACSTTLNAVMALGNVPASALRARLSDLLRDGGSDDARQIADQLLSPMVEATLHVPAAIGDFTDFYTSRFHAERAGKISRPDNPLPPCFLDLPVAYHSRTSSIFASGQVLKRPLGQWKKRGDSELQFGAVDAIDYELEFGLFIGAGNEYGRPIPIDEAESHIFGYGLVNDWSMRLVQSWEMVVGPFQSKSILTSVSPWVVTSEAMAPFRAPARPRSCGDPSPLSYLTSPQDRAEGSIDVKLTADLETERTRREGAGGMRITTTNFQVMYWTFAQMIAHHTLNGCNLRPGDLIASGTTSGPDDDTGCACLLEQNQWGSREISLPNGERRVWLEDGDEVVFRGRAERDGYVSIGLGECRGRVTPADWAQAK